MANKFTGSVTHNVNFSDEITEGDGTFISTAAKTNLKHGLTFNDATSTVERNILSGAVKSNANEGFGAEFTVAAGATKELDLSGTLLDRHGNTVALLTIKYIAIVNLSNDITFTVKPTAAAGLTTIFTGTSPAQKIPPYGHWAASAPKSGFAVTLTTADKLDVTADSPAGISGGVFRIVVIGTIAA